MNTSDDDVNSLVQIILIGAGHSVVEENRDDLEKIIGCVCDPLTQQLQTTASGLPSQVSKNFEYANKKIISDRKLDA